MRRAPASALAAAMIAALAACGGGHSGNAPDAASEPDAHVDPPMCTGMDCTDLYVATTGGGTACTMAAPCAHIGDAIKLRTATRKTIHVAAGAYTEVVFINGGGEVTLLGDGVDLSPDHDGSPVEIEGELAVTLVGFDLHGGKGTIGDPIENDGVSCRLMGASRPRVTLDHVTIHDNARHGVYAAGCDLDLERAMIRNNKIGGLSIDGTFVVRNTFIVDNGTASDPGSANGVDVVREAAPGSVFEFNTVVGNRAGVAATASGVSAGASTSRFRDNLVFGNAPVDGGVPHKIPQTTGGMWSYSLFADKVPPAGDHNATVADPMFTDASHGDYHLGKGSPAIDAADPSATVAVDWDGDTRPAGNGRDIGADEAK